MILSLGRKNTFLKEHSSTLQLATVNHYRKAALQQWLGKRASDKYIENEIIKYFKLNL